MEAEEISVTLTSRARAKLIQMEDEFGVEVDCIQMMWSEGGSFTNPDGTSGTLGPSWIVGWNRRAAVKPAMPFNPYVKFEEIEVLFPQNHLWPEINGKTLDYKNNRWEFE